MLSPVNMSRWDQGEASGMREEHLTSGTRCEASLLFPATSQLGCFRCQVLFAALPASPTALACQAPGEGLKRCGRIKFNSRIWKCSSSNTKRTFDIVHDAMQHLQVWFCTKLSRASCAKLRSLAEEQRYFEFWVKVSDMFKGRICLLGCRRIW